MKRLLLIAQITAAIFFAFGLSALSASAQKIPGRSSLAPSPSFPHIDVTGCSVSWQSTMRPWSDPFGATHHELANNQAFLQISYSNTSTAPATAVVFGLVSYGKLIAVAHDSAAAHQIGAFSHNALVTGQFAIPGTVFPRLFPVEAGGDGIPYNCAVLKVAYADGSVWRNENPPF